MSNRVLQYFYAPTWDYPPAGPIKLGNVLMSIKKPENPLFTAPLPTAEEVFTMNKTDVEFSTEKLNGGHLTILTKFLSIFGLGVDTGVQWDRRGEDFFKFERLETVQFVPRAEYIQSCIEADPVRTYLEMSCYRKPVYVVTGIKTVYGAMGKTMVSRSYGGMVGVELDGTMMSGGLAPLGGGPEIGGQREDKRWTAWHGSDDFVLAFKVRKVYVDRRTGKVNKNDDYTKGAMLGSDDPKAASVPDIVVREEEDPDPRAEGFYTEETMEGEKVVSCSFLSKNDDLHLQHRAEVSKGTLL
ncbi:hypothetical protein MGG_05802 [Pyricularia oryzae 70-15]|uniref:Uncharacterized protein n=1 Tax=Pyricularia oryzae (strain 70-15 / ATCC MYA-4617 / FGSC 8958) TaxID=242507 RepID=G4N0H4_PYRO7|nr:uncharacterized protein MGG_05802 [Pyricularia oryzae 70-15]EHA52308.1 hypothetical protein MGG_05802 [Pyricularia oryzae 70-15]KAI7909550.1 hypothetical protein M9X92_011568 [Pyricularia oryzae]KAI7910345.1 hypothetical protein M0657_011412 [Pyricularia oryzae]